jgi:polar amino acid transport system substrate-binding protein
VPAATPAEAIAALAQGRAHVAAGGVISGQPDASIDYSLEVFPSRAVIVTRRPAPPVEFIEGLRGIRVAFSSGNAVSEALAAAKVRASSLEELGSAAEVVAALREGRAGAGVVRLDEALRAFGRDPELALGAGIGARQSLALAVRRGDVALLRELNQHLSQLRSTPSWGHLVEKHFGREALPALARARLSDGSALQKP